MSGFQTVKEKNGDRCAVGVKRDTLKGGIAMMAAIEQERSVRLSGFGWDEQLQRQ